MCDQHEFTRYIFTQFRSKYFSTFSPLCLMSYTILFSDVAHSCLSIKPNAFWRISVHAWIHFHESYHWICLNRLLDLKSFVYSFCHHNKVMCLLDISYVLLKYYINNLAHLIVAYNTTPIQYRYKCMVYGWE